MTEHALIEDEQLVEKAVNILVREMGSVDAGRFLSMPQKQRMESVKRHPGRMTGSSTMNGSHRNT